MYCAVLCVCVYVCVWVCVCVCDGISGQVSRPGITQWISALSSFSDMRVRARTRTYTHTNISGQDLCTFDSTVLKNKLQVIGMKQSRMDYSLVQTAVCHFTNQVHGGPNGRRWLIQLSVTDCHVTKLRTWPAWDTDWVRKRTSMARSCWHSHIGQNTVKSMRPMLYIFSLNR